MHQTLTLSPDVDAGRLGDAAGWRIRTATADVALAKIDAFIGCAGLKDQVRRLADVALIDSYWLRRMTMPLR